MIIGSKLFPKKINVFPEGVFPVFVMMCYGFLGSQGAVHNDVILFWLADASRAFLTTFFSYESFYSGMNEVTCWSSVLFVMVRDGELVTYRTSVMNGVGRAVILWIMVKCPEEPVNMFTTADGMLPPVQTVSTTEDSNSWQFGRIQYWHPPGLSYIFNYCCVYTMQLQINKLGK